VSPASAEPEGNAAIPGVDVIGKTGTTSSNKTCGSWAPPNNSLAVFGLVMTACRVAWFFGSKWSAPLWRNFMVQALDVWSKRNIMAKMIEDERATTQARRAAEQSKKFITRRICDESGMISTAGCTRTHVVQFSAGGDVPSQTCTIPAHMAQSEPVRRMGKPVLNPAI
jgi:hypothetical protein